MPILLLSFYLLSSLFILSIYLLSDLPLWNLDLDFTTTAAHLYSLLFLPLFLSLPCFALSLSGWLLHQPRQELILEFCPWFPPLSPWAVTCQRCPPLGSPSCCNYLWHPGSGASTQVTLWRGLGAEVWKEEREVLSVQPTGRCQKCRWSVCYCRIKLYSLVPLLKRPLH